MYLLNTEPHAPADDDEDDDDDEKSVHTHGQGYVENEMTIMTRVFFSVLSTWSYDECVYLILNIYVHLNKNTHKQLGRRKLCEDRENHSFYIYTLHTTQDEDEEK